MTPASPLLLHRRRPGSCGSCSFHVCCTELASKDLTRSWTHAHALCVARLVWFAQVKYTIGGLSFSTLDMEHGVLRGNAPSPAALAVLLGQPQLAKPYFQDSDPRKKLVRCLSGWEPPATRVEDGNMLHAADPGLQPFQYSDTGTAVQQYSRGSPAKPLQHSDPRRKLLRCLAAKHAP